MQESRRQLDTAHQCSGENSWLGLWIRNSSICTSYYCPDSQWDYTHKRGLGTEPWSTQTFGGLPGGDTRKLCWGRWWRRNDGNECGVQGGWGNKPSWRKEGRCQPHQMLLRDQVGEELKMSHWLQSHIAIGDFNTSEWNKLQKECVVQWWQQIIHKILRDVT